MSDDRWQYTPEGKLHMSRETLRRKILEEEDLPVEVGSLADIEKALSKVEESEK